MTSYTVTRKKNTDTSQFQVVLIVITFLSSFVVPFIILYPIQELLYRPNDIWFFEASMSTYLTFCAALISVSAILLINVLFIPKSKAKKTVKGIIVILSLLAAVIVMILCVDNYYYMNSKGIYKNNLFSFSEEFISWDEIDKAEQTFLKKQRVTVEDKLILTTKDGKTIEMQITKKMSANKASIRQSLKNNGVILENSPPITT
ncbi:hypothetical protein [Cytobacillus massiliigabonensis]|uniref:hypothetical protein n=1 Tax=Cytobacillus massiliigabonensis TaxID=1871011 RepID=UPI000C81DC30|nr:hypothetical protein [Cytobacillus massiliigabonensis]